MEKLYVIDASGYLYRSYFAIRNMTNAKGESTNALFGFIRSIMKLRKDFNPDHMVSVFDGPHGVKKRTAIYADYKAHRTAMPPDLRYQIEWAKQVCEWSGIPILSVPEVEADDTMGSVALWGAKHGALVYLCTSDKDLCQLVSDNILILNTFKENQILGAKEVQENFGVLPSQMIDLLAMTGDTSDNVPGMPGIGPKTASQLLQQFGTLDNILSHPEEIQGKKQEIIINYADQARLSRQLVTIHTDVPFEEDRSFFALKNPQYGPLKDFYSAMNFGSLLRELELQRSLTEPEIKTSSAETTKEVTYTLVDSEETLTQFLGSISKYDQVCISTIGSQPQPFKATLVGIAFCANEEQAWYVPVNGELGFQRLFAPLQELFVNPNIHFCGHNIKYDLQVLANAGIFISSISFDTMLASYLLYSHHRQHSLEHQMLENFSKVRKTLPELLGKGKSAIPIELAPPQHLSSFCGEAAHSIFKLRSQFESLLKERKLEKLFYEVELPLLTLLAKMERDGIFLDVPYLNKISRQVIDQIGALEQEIYALAGEKFNLNSPKQLSEILFTKLGIKSVKKTATGLSTNADVLEYLKDQYPIAGKLIEYRTLEKLRSTYIENLPFEINPKTNRIHCTFNQTVAATGRLSCQDPNLQNIPIRSEIGRMIRGAFRPEKSNWSYLAADYSQIELRLLAHFSEDPHLIKAFKNGEDIHASTAAHIFGIPLDQVTKEMRHQAKAVNFGIVYGQQAFGLSQELGIDLKEAALFIEAYFHRYKNVKQFIEECKEKARTTGRATTYIGRERLIPEINSKNGQLRAAAERLAMNTPLQGTTADLIKMAMLTIDQRLREENCEGFMILQIHDELIFELPDSEIPIIEPIVRDAMQNVVSLKVPLVVDINIGKNWAAC